MLQDLCLSTILVSGLLLSVFSAAGAISAEIDDQTILTIVSKPINRLAFIAGKFLGVMSALLLANIFMTVTFQMVIRHGVLWAAYIPRDIPILVFGFGAVGLTLILAGLANYMFDWQFAPTAMAIGLPLMLFAFLLGGFLDINWQLQSFGQTYSLDIFYACLLLLLAVWVIAGLCLVCSTRLNVVWTLVTAFIILCLGMITDWLLLDKIQENGWTLAKAGYAAIYAIIPNFQVFWMLDALNKADTHISANYLLQSTGYALCYLLAALFLAYALFLDRQVGSANKI
jgi:hypothetical protein